MKPLVIFHGPGCMDGAGAALAAWLRFGEEAEYRPAQYGDPAPTDDEIRGRDCAKGGPEEPIRAHDVSAVAKSFGGGGHAKAAGFECITLPWQISGTISISELSGMLHRERSRISDQRWDIADAVAVVEKWLGR